MGSIWPFLFYQSVSSICRYRAAWTVINCIFINRMCKTWNESIIFDALLWFLELENYLDSVAMEWRRIQIDLKLVLTIDRLWQTRFSKAFPLSYHQSITIIPSKKWSGQTKSFFDFLLRKCEWTCIVFNRQRLAHRKGIRTKTSHELQKLTKVTWKVCPVCKIVRGYLKRWNCW